MSTVVKKPARKPAAKAGHPSYQVMVYTVVKDMSAGKKGVHYFSRSAIVKAVMSRYKLTIDEKTASRYVCMAIRKLVDSGKLIRKSGKGASGSFRCAPKSAEPKKPAAKKPKAKKVAPKSPKKKAPAKKTAAKKASAKKPAAKKAPAKKTAAKKAPVKKTAAKKAPVKKPAAKKAPVKKPAAKKAPAKKPAAKK